MITRLYANNFRCLVAFETSFDSFGVLCGPNGAGKSSVFDALRLIRNLAAGDAILGGDRDQDIPRLEFTKWQSAVIQEFEVGFRIGENLFAYEIQLEQKADFEKPRIVLEKAICNDRILFKRDLESVQILKHDGTWATFPLDWRQTALAAIQPRGSIEKLAILQEAIAKLLILRPNPRGMERESKAEARHPDTHFTGLTSWYRSLAQDLEWALKLRDLIREVWPDFKSFKLMDVGINTKALQLSFDGTRGGGACEILFEQLSDGEKALVGLYMVRAALTTGAVRTVLIDEPDNFVGLPELQPWILSMRELLDDHHQAILITHHPELLSSSGQENGRYLWRDNHTSPTRIGPLNIPEGMSPGEAIARGWVRV